MSKIKPSIREKMAELDELIAWFDSEDFELEEAIEKFALAKKIAENIENELLVVKNTITVIGEQFDREVE